MTTHNSKLRTDFICVATSGSTVDGREITAQQLHDMADNYDPTYYTANLWPEHRRWLNMGQVLELKAEDQENGETKLYAVMAPSEMLINYNKQGRYLFTSIEIAPNFRNSGKDYLFGLGVTDTPASVGTTQLQFRQIAQETINSDFIKCNFTLKEDESEYRSFFSTVKAFFTKQETAVSQHHIDQNNNNEDEPMNKEQFDALLAAVVVLGEKIDQRFAAQTEAQAESADPPKVEQVEAPAALAQVTPEQFNQLFEAVQNLDKKFNALSQEATPIPNGVPQKQHENTVQVDGYSFNFGAGEK